MKAYKKSLCTLLALLMLFSLSAPAFAASNTAQICPVIHVPGINTSTIYTDVNDPDSEATIPDKDTLLKSFEEKILPALLKYVDNEDVDTLAHVVATEINELFKDWFLESTGDAKEGSGVVFNDKPAYISSKSQLIFHYDWRCDPVAAADDLNDYINHVLKKSGCSKVALTCHSLGSSVAMAYLAKYGNEKIYSMLLDSPACEGVTFVGSVLSGDATLNSSAITYFLEYTLGQAEYNDLSASILELFNVAGVPELFKIFFDKIIKDISPVIYKETLIPLLGCWPSMWALSPDAYIDKAEAFVFDEIMAGEDYSALKAKIENYNQLIRGKRETILRDFDEKGILAIISRYGFPSLPVADTGNLIGDDVIETKATSLGATTAPTGTYFDDKYLEGKDMKYISPDRTIDASTCMFPEKTWFIKDMEHSEHYKSSYYDIFLFPAEELTCDTAPVGRFTIFDRETALLVEDNTEPVKIEKENALQRLITFVRNLIERIRKFFDSFLKK